MSNKHDLDPSAANRAIAGAWIFEKCLRCGTWVRHDEPRDGCLPPEPPPEVSAHSILGAIRGLEIALGWKVESTEIGTRSVFEHQLGVASERITRAVEKKYGRIEYMIFAITVAAAWAAGFACGVLKP